MTRDHPTIDGGVCFPDRPETSCDIHRRQTTLSVDEAQRMLDEAKRQFEWDSSVRAGRKVAAKHRAASARQVDLEQPNPIRRRNADA